MSLVPYAKPLSITNPANNNRFTLLQSTFSAPLTSGMSSHNHLHAPIRTDTAVKPIAEVCEQEW